MYGFHAELEPRDVRQGARRAHVLPKVTPKDMLVKMLMQSASSPVNRSKKNVYKQDQFKH